MYRKPEEKTAWDILTEAPAPPPEPSSVSIGQRFPTNVGLKRFTAKEANPKPVKPPEPPPIPEPPKIEERPKRRRRKS